MVWARSHNTAIAVRALVTVRLTALRCTVRMRLFGAAYLGLMAHSYMLISDGCDFGC
jgi:hypothetical protein